MFLFGVEFSAVLNMASIIRLMWSPSRKAHVVLLMKVKYEMRNSANI